jgi:hypothetical protein
MSNPLTFPNRIKLISRGRHEEAVAGADCYPGQLVMLNSAGLLIPHNVVGGSGLAMVAIEDALRGGDITQKLPSGYVAPYQMCAKGDLMLMLLAIGQNVLKNASLMSDGAGGLTAYLGSVGGSKLYEILAPSATVTNTVAETTFSNGSFALAANYLQVGDVLRIHSKAFCIAVAAAATQRIKTYLNTTVLADSAAQALVANDIVVTDVTLTIRTITATGTFIADGQVEYSIAGTFTSVPFTVASTAFDSTAIQTIATKVTASAAATGNQIRLDEFEITLDRAGLPSQFPIVQAAEAINNSAGSAYAPIRSLIL